MSYTQAVKAYGSQLYYATITAGVVGSYTKVAHTKDLKGPNPEIGDIKITNNDSPNATHEYMPGLCEPGDQELNVVYDKTQAATLYGLMDGTTVYGFAEKYPDGAGWTYQGYVKGFGTEGNTDDGYLENTMKIKLTSKPVFSATLTATGIS